MSIVLDPAEVMRWWEEADDDPSRMAAIAIRKLAERAAEGDVNAQVVLDHWTHVGARQELKRARQGLRQVVMPASPANGHSALPVRLSVKRDDGARQLVAFETLTFVDFGVWLAEYRAHHRTRTNVLRTAERLLAVWSEHPEELGSDALRRAGIDPADLDESQAATGTDG